MCSLHDRFPLLDGGVPPLLALTAFTGSQVRPRAGPRGKAVRDRRDPVTVIGDETRTRAHWRAAPGRARGVGRSESQETCLGPERFEPVFEGRPGLPHATSPSRSPRPSSS